MGVEFTNIERDGVRTAYTASIELDGQVIGYVQRLRGEERYHAHVDGLRVSSARTLAECRDDIAAYVEHDRAPRDAD